MVYILCWFGWVKFDWEFVWACSGFVSNYTFSRNRYAVYVGWVVGLLGTWSMWGVDEINQWLLSYVVSVINLIVSFRRRYGKILLNRWGDGRWQCLGRHRSVSYHSACRDGHAPPANKYDRPCTASPTCSYHMTAITDETPIGLHGIHAGRDMKIMQANQRSSYINTAVSAYRLAPGRKVRQDPIS